MAETGTLYDAFIDELRGTRSSPTLAEGGINQDAADATAERKKPSARALAESGLRRQGNGRRERGVIAVFET